MPHQPKYSNKKKPLCSSITTSSIHVVSTSTSDQLFPREQYTITSQDHPSTSPYPNYFNQGVIPYPIPMNSRPTPAYQPANSGTIGNNWSNFSYNKACLGGVEIIAGGSEADGIRTWRNNVYFIVRAKEV